MSHNPFSTSLFVSPLPSSGTGPGGHRKHFRTSSPPSSDYVFPPSNRPRTTSSNRPSGVHPIPIPCRRRSDVDFGTPESPFSPTLFDYYHHRRPTSSLGAPVGVEVEDKTLSTPVMTPREELDIPFFPFETISLHSSSSSSSTHGSSDGSFDVSIESSDPPMGFDPNLRRRSLAGPPTYRQGKPPMEVSTEFVGSFPTEIPESKTMRRLPSGGVVSGWGIDALENPDRRSTKSSSSGTPVGSMTASSPCGDNTPWLKETKASLSLASVEKANVIASPQTSPIGVNRRCSIPLPVLDTQSTPPTRRFSLPPRPRLRTHKSDLSESSSSSSGGLGLGSNRLTGRRTSSLGLIGVELPPCIEGDPTSIVQGPASYPFSPRTSELPTVVSPPSPPATPIIRANGGISSSVEGGDGRPCEIKGYRRGSCLELPSSPMQTGSPTPTSLSRPLPSVSSNQLPYSPSFSPSSASASSPSTTSSSPSSSRVVLSEIEIFYDPESPIAPLCRKLLLSLHRRSTRMGSDGTLARVGSTILDGSGFGNEAGGARPKVRLTLGGGSSRGRVGGGDRMVVEEFDPTGMSLDQVLERIDRSVVDC